MKRAINVRDKLFTNRSQGVNAYLQSLDKNLLTVDQEVEWVKRYRYTTDPVEKELAFNTLVKKNLLFAFSTAKKYEGLRGSSMSIMDLVGAANLGLMKAVERFDETKGFKLISYAVFWIRQSIMEEIAQNRNLIRTPQNQLQMEARYRETSKELFMHFDREPTKEEIEEATGEIIKYHSVSAVSIFSPYGEEGELIDTIPSNLFDIERDIDKEANKHAVELVLENIHNPERREAVRLYFGINCVPMTTPDIGEKMGKTPESIRGYINKELANIARKIREGSLDIGLSPRKRTKKKEKNEL